MKTKLFSTMAIVAIIAIAIIALPLVGCKDEPEQQEQPQKQPDTPRTLTFGTLEGQFTVTIKSDDQFTADEWKTLCDKVVAAIESEYSRGDDAFNKWYFEQVFETEKNCQVKILPSSVTYKCEVKANDYTIYLRVDTISTADLQTAVVVLSGGLANQQQ